MKQIVVGIGECAVTPHENTTLVTYGLGSCIGIAAWNPLTGVAGLLHYMLPDSVVESRPRRDNPYLYADTAIPAFLNVCMRQGAKRSRLIFRAAGGARVLGDPDLFNIGHRKESSLKKILAGSGLQLRAELLGGGVSRTLRIEARSGRCWMEQAGTVQELIAVRHGVERP